MQRFITRHILFLYYLTLFVLETPILFNIGVPSTGLRIGYLVLLIFPIWFFDKSYLPLVVLAAYSISKFGTAVTLMPTEVWYYVPVFLLMAFPFKSPDVGLRIIPLSVFVLCLDTLFVDIFSTQSVHDIFLCFVILIILFYYYSPQIDNESYFQIFSCIFIAISVILSLEMLFVGEQYIENYGYTDMERVLWADPNYLGGVIGMGCMASAVLLFRNIKNSLKILLVITLLLTITALVVNASRGALLAVICGVAVLLLGRGLKVWQKIIVLVVAAVFVFELYNNSYFDLLLYRVENDSGGGSGRVGIWLKKWDAYTDNPSFLQLLFGMGFDNGYKAGFTYSRAFHNDFLAILVDYGLVGFVTFISMFFYPLKGVLLKDKAILGCVVFLLINCMTLEPFCLGVLIFYFFWLYTCFQGMAFRRGISKTVSHNR